MAKNKKSKNKSKGDGAKSANKNAISKQDYAGRLSIVIPLYNEQERFHLLQRAIERFQQNWNGVVEFIYVNDGSTDNTLELLQQTYANQSNELHQHIIVDQAENRGKGYALKSGVEQATGDHILTLDADMAAHPNELSNWLKDLERELFPDNVILIGSREHSRSTIQSDGNQRRLLGRAFNYYVQTLSGLPIHDTQCGFKLFPSNIAKWLFGQLQETGWAHDIEILHLAKLYNISIREMPLRWKEVDVSKVSVWSDGFKMGLSSIKIVASNLFRFFFTLPIKEIKKGIGVVSDKESPLFRSVFSICSLLLLILMPYLSFDYGITADEDVQQNYGELVLKYFETDGVDGEALQYKNLYLYGGLFDYHMAWAQKYLFPSWNVFEVRHMFNALVGALLMILTGLLTRRLTGSWMAACVSLLFIFLSPRIFGHSMNNPKDIPFAAGYVFTLYFMLGFLKTLPRFSLNAIVGMIIGIALTINMRVGGLLLIPYLFLFTGLSFFFKEEMRNRLLNFGYLFKSACVLSIVSFLGYYGGSLYWPFALEDPMGAPMEALSEMSNFATGIRMVWEGEHYWSDFLPWYYILQWIIMTTPVAILLLSVLFVLPFFKDSKTLFYYLFVGFVGLFPIAYAIYQKSALYDGMRHFLFVYPLFVVVAAYVFKVFISMMNARWMKMVTAVVFLLTFIGPIRWMFASHPNQYMYFNEFAGGLSGSYNQYENDYWMNSTKEACDWMIENIPAIKAGEPIRVGTQAYWSVFHYFAPYENVKVVYTRYHERVKSNWDYGLYVSRFVNHGVIKSGLWPPGQDIIYERKVDGVPICSIHKRSDINKKGARANQFFKNKDYVAGLVLIDSIITEAPGDESAWLLKAQYSLQIRDFSNAKKALDTLMRFSPTFSNSLGMYGVYYMNLQKLDSAKLYFERATEANIKYVFGHYNLASILANERQFEEAIEHLELFDAYGGRPIQGYDLAIQIAGQFLKNDAVRLYFMAKKASLNGDWNTALPYLNQSLAITPDYEPALKLQANYKKALRRQQKMQERNQRLNIK